MQGAMRRMSMSTAQASAGGSGTSKELSNSTRLLRRYSPTACAKPPCAFDQMTFDLRTAPEAFWLFAHVQHRQRQPLGKPRREGNSRRLPARNRVELLKAGLPLYRGDAEIDQRLPHPRKRDEPSTIGIDR